MKKNTVIEHVKTGEFVMEKNKTTFVCKDTTSNRLRKAGFKLVDRGSYTDIIGVNSTKKVFALGEIFAPEETELLRKGKCV